MSEYVDFHYLPLEGRITGKQVLQQTEDAINDLGNKVYNLDVDEERIDEAIENSEQAIDTANSALSAVTTDRAVWKNTVAEMKATDIDLGVTAATRGKMAFNDGDGAFYGVRSEKGGDVESDDTVFLNNGNVAERIKSMNIIAKGNNIIFVANVAELIDSDALIGNVYGTTGYYSTNDGGAGLYSIRTKTQSDVDDGGSIIFLDNGNVAELITDGTVTPEQFGAYGDGTHDDTDAIKKWASCGVTSLRLHKSANYYVKDQIEFTSICTLIGNKKATFVIDNTFSGASVFLVSRTMCRISGVKFERPNDATLTIPAILCKRDIGSANVDVEITNCEFENFWECIKTYGRGLRAFDNLFVRPAYAIHQLMEHSPSESGDSYYQLPPWDGRALNVQRNRMHTFYSNGRYNYMVYIEDCNLGERYLGVIVADNLIDAGGGLISCNADITQSVISNNVSIGNNNSSEFIKLSGNASDIIIDNNVTGIRYQTSSDYQTNSFSQFIVLGNSGKTVDGITLINNSITGTRTYPVWINCASSNIIFKNNIFKKLANDGSSRPMIQTNGDVTTAIIKDNIVADNSTINRIIRASSGGTNYTLTNVITKNNIAPNLTEVAQGTIGSGCSIES